MENLKNIWKPELYRIQLEAPVPKRVSCENSLERPEFYGKEYHGVMGHKEASLLLEKEPNGAFLIRKGNEHNDFYTLTWRDEFYKRPAQKMSPWIEDCNIYGGRDLQSGCEGGTWLAVSRSMKKIGLLLNLPNTPKKDAKSRGKIVEKYVKSTFSTNEFVQSMQNYFQECNEFVLVAIEFGDTSPVVETYNNATNELKQWQVECLGFSNSLPENPLNKVKAGKLKLQEICNKFNKIDNKEKLIDKLIVILKSEERNLPDPQLQERRPHSNKELSSIFVKIPEGGYGTRTHTILLVTKTGKVNLIEITMQNPIDPLNPCWERNEFEFDI